MPSALGALVAIFMQGKDTIFSRVLERYDSGSIRFGSMREYSANRWTTLNWWTRNVVAPRC